MIKQFLSQNSHWQINKTFARSFGIEATILMTDLVDKWIFHNRPEWFFNTADKIEEDTTLSRYKQSKAFKVLEENGFIKKKVMGQPAKLHFKLFENKILSFFNSSFKETSKLELKEFENSYSKNKLSKNKLSKNKPITKDIVEQKNCSTISDDQIISIKTDLTKNDKSEMEKSGLKEESKREPSPAPEIQANEDCYLKNRSFPEYVSMEETLPQNSDAKTESQEPEKENLPPPPKPDIPPRKVMYYDAVEEIIHYLNDATGRTFSSGADHSKYIRARLSDGHKIQVLKDVIDLKASEWTGDDTMEKYLRPQTLFNKTKFTAYIEELTYIRKKNKMLERLKITVDNFVKSAGLVLIWSHNEEKALYDLAHKINKSNKQRGDPTTASQINESLDILLKKLPDFWFEKFSITKLDKNFNSIINEIRKSNGGKDAEWAAYVASFDQPQAGTA